MTTLNNVTNEEFSSFLRTNENNKTVEIDKSDNNNTDEKLETGYYEKNKKLKDVGKNDVTD